MQQLRGCGFHLAADLALYTGLSESLFFAVPCISIAQSSITLCFHLLSQSSHNIDV